MKRGKNTEEAAAEGENDTGSGTKTLKNNFFPLKISLKQQKKVNQHLFHLVISLQLLQRRPRKQRSPRLQFCTMTPLIKRRAKTDAAPTWRSPPGTWMDSGRGWKRMAWMWVSCKNQPLDWRLGSKLKGCLFPSGCVRRTQTSCASRRPSAQRKPFLLRSRPCQSTPTSTGLCPMTRRDTVA